MLDAALRPLINPPLALLAKQFVKLGIRADWVTWAGFALGMVAIPLLAMQLYIPALVFIVLNRLADGLDGAIARQTSLTDYGGFIDISLDFIFYAGVVLGMSLGRPDGALYGAFLLWCFFGPAVTFLAYAIFAAKRGITTDLRGAKSLFYLGGLAEGTETFAIFILFCLAPAWFPVVCIVYGAMCLITAATRIYAAWAAFGDSDKGSNGE